ncbi:MAG TPA: hypothetical protein VF800_02830 [Telluria sp.]|jgi:hypothetical protein
MASEMAKAIQASRDAENIANHRERIEWLSAKQPCWACGEPVDAHMRNTLMAQSRTALGTQTK